MLILGNIRVTITKFQNFFRGHFLFIWLELLHGARIYLLASILFFLHLFNVLRRPR